MTEVGTPEYDFGTPAHEFVTLECKSPNKKSLADKYQILYQNIVKLPVELFVVDPEFELV